jgi:hypothetical protein
MKSFKEIYDENKTILDEVYSCISSDDILQLKKALSPHLDLINVPMYGGAGFSRGLLHEAAQQGHLEISLYLIDCGIDVNVVDDVNLTPLVAAAEAGEYEVVTALITKGAWIDGASSAATTPLISAATKGHYEIVEYLIECGADINRLQSNHNCTALDIAIAYENVYDNKRVIESLKSKSALHAHEPLNFSVERAAVVLGTVHTEAGWVLSNKLSRNTIDVRTALLKDDKKHKILFTIGAFQQQPKREIMLCVPHSWPVNRQLMSENTHASFPIQFLFALAEHRLVGEELDEGCIFEKQDVKWNKLFWPEKIDGFIAVDYEFGSKSDPLEYSEETVKLLMLVPIKYPKSGCPKGEKLEEWIKKRKCAKWSANALKYDYINDEKRLQSR